MKEGPQQKRLEQFMQERDSEAIHLLNAFQSLSETELSGEWASVVPDSRILEEDGQKFFWRMRELQEAALGGSQKTRVGSLYNKVEECRKFVYNVRCNIFHGSKTLGETYEPAQKLRIEVYFVFLHSLNVGIL